MWSTGLPKLAYVKLGADLEFHFLRGIYNKNLTCKSRNKVRQESSGMEFFKSHDFMHKSPANFMGGVGVGVPCMIPC